MARNSSTAAFDGAAAAIARAIGCSESSSIEPASDSSSSEDRSEKETTSSTPNRPSVSVPVLSKMTASISLAFSKAIRLRTSSPFRAPSAVDTATTSGIASPRACGHAMTMTVTARSIAYDSGSPSASHTTKVSAPPPSATNVSHSAARSARSCVLDFDSCASRTRSMTWERNESAPVLGDRYGQRAFSVDRPADDESPADFDTGTDSPVSRDSSTAEAPSRTSPSAGTFSPGLTTTTSPGWSSSSGTSTRLPSDSGDALPRA